MDREEDIYSRLLYLIASSESGRGARRGRDSATMSTDAWDDMQSRPDAADFPASAALSTEHRTSRTETTAALFVHFQSLA